jgi:hypothetical protein
MARDLIHDLVKNALIKDGWTITDDPYVIEYKEITLYADLGAERPIAAERDSEKIVVEVKSFIGRSVMQDLKVAVGQYVVYLSLLEVVEPNRHLYLAISEQIYYDLFQLEAVQIIIQRHHIALVVVNVKREEVVLWTK